MTTPAHSALYLSVPFCRTKCSFCNFASGVFSRELLDRYVAHMETAIVGAPALADQFGAAFDPVLDSIYLGGGTPSMISPDQLDRLFVAIASVFEVAPSPQQAKCGLAGDPGQGHRRGRSRHTVTWGFGRPAALRRESRLHGRAVVH